MRDEASREIFTFIEEFNNWQWLHQSLVCLNPLEFDWQIGES